MKKIIGILMCLLLCFGICYAVDELYTEVSGTQIESGEKTVSLGSVKQDDAKNTLRKERITLKENVEDEYYIGDEVEQTYGNPLLQILISIAVFVIVVITIFTVAKKTIQ